MLGGALWSFWDPHYHINYLAKAYLVTSPLHISEHKQNLMWLGDKFGRWISKLFDIHRPTNRRRWRSLHKKWSFPLRISSVNVTKSTITCGFGHIYWRNPTWKTSFFVQLVERGTFDSFHQIDIQWQSWAMKLIAALGTKKILKENFTSDVVLSVHLEVFFFLYHIDVRLAITSLRYLYCEFKNTFKHFIKTLRTQTSTQEFSYQLLKFLWTIFLYKTSPGDCF